MGRGQTSAVVRAGSLVTKPRLSLVKKSPLTNSLTVRRQMTTTPPIPRCPLLAQELGLTADRLQNCTGPDLGRLPCPFTIDTVNYAGIVRRMNYVPLR